MLGFTYLLRTTQNPTTLDLHHWNVRVNSGKDGQCSRYTTTHGFDYQIDVYRDSNIIFRSEGGKLDHKNLVKGPCPFLSPILFEMIILPL